jgi:DNA repair exonuclease SbcCD ATPase subunit
MPAELTPEMMDALDDLESQYQTVRDNFDEMDHGGKFASTNEREQMAESVKVALMNWVRAKNRILDESSATVKKLSTEAGKAQKAIEAALKDLQNLKKTLNIITKAVNTVASVVATLN